MLYYLLLYQFESNALLYEKDIKVDNKAHIDMFGNFFSAIKSFMLELRIGGLKELKTVGLGSFTAFITQIPESRIDLVLISDKDDSKIIKNLTSKIVKIILNYKEIFTSEMLNLVRFQEFDNEINKFLLSEQKVVDPTILLERKEEILKSIWDQKGKLSQRLREEKERFKRINQETLIYLKNRLTREENLIKRERIVKKIVEVSEKLENDTIKEEYQNLVINLDSQIKERKLKLSYYFSKTLESLKDLISNYSGIYLINANFHEVYSHLYSFSSKLKDFAPNSLNQKFLSISKYLIDKSDITKESFADLINQILNMEKDSKLQSYLN